MYTPVENEGTIIHHQHDDEAAMTIANGVKLGVQSAFCPADTTRNSPFSSRLAAVR